MTDPSYRGQILVFTQPLMGCLNILSPQTFSVVVLSSPTMLRGTAIGLLLRASVSGVPVKEYRPSLELILAPL
jgi:carbamoylphosphate synthase small subunit